MNSHLIILLFSAVLLSSCTKELVTDNHPEFTGEWVHHPKEGSNVHFLIYEGGSGYISYDGTNEIDEETKSRNWYLEQGKLFFGKRRAGKKASSHFHIYRIAVYPTVSDYDFTVEFNTVHAGDTFMILNEDLYVNSKPDLCAELINN